MTATGKHTDFIGWTVTDHGLDGLQLPVVQAALDTTCDFCDDGGAAEYKVDTTELGDAGQDVFYCQGHIRGFIDGGIDTWTPPEEPVFCPDCEADVAEGMPHHPICGLMAEQAAEARGDADRDGEF